MEKKFFDTILSRFERGTLNVTFWDGSSKSYGNGKPSVDITIHSPKVVRAAMRNLSLGIGEAYMDKTFEAEPIGNFLDIVYMNLNAHAGFNNLLNTVTKLSKNIRTKQSKYIQHHYDLGNDFYKLWLDNDTMAYTCAYFKTPKDTLEQAQNQKFDHVLRKLQLKKGMEVAEFGCGWGHLLVKAAKEYGVTGIGVTLSTEQYNYATKLAKKEGVDKQITFELANYQDLAERGKMYDRVYSVGIFEHVGKGNQAQYFDAVNKLLKPGGVSFLHTISQQKPHKTDAWIDRYIFPGGHLHSVAEMVSYLPPYDFRLMDYESLRLHYALTLDEWRKRFESHHDKIVKMFDERFYRMWDFWLAASSASFRYGELDLTQMVFSKGINNDLPLTREHIYKD